MTQGQGGGKVKLHKMNLVEAGSPITNMGFVRIFCPKYGGISVTPSFSLTVPSPSVLVEKKEKKKKKNSWDFGQFHDALGMGSGPTEWYAGPLHTRQGVVLN